MNSWKIINRLVFLALAPALIIAVFLTAYYSLRSIHDLNDKVTERGNAIVSSLASVSEAGVHNTDLEQLDNQADRTLRESGVVSVEITDRAGGILLREARPSAELTGSNRILRRIAEYLYQDNTSSFTRDIFVSVPSDSGGVAVASPEHGDVTREIGSVTIVLSTAPTNYQETVIIVKGIAIVLVILGISSLFAFSTTRSISRPIEAIIETVNSIQKGMLDARVPVTAGGELGALQQGVNLMAERINASHDNLIRAVNLSTRELNKRIKEINQKNHELEVAMSRAEDANLAKSRFLANMSHELRTPMNAIIGFTDLLGEFKVDDAHRDYVDTIRRSAADLLILINEILDYSKIESGELKIEKCEFDFYELVDDIINLLNKTAYEKNLDLFVYIDPDVPLKLVSDPLRVKQTIINLLSNAIKFTNEGHVSLEINRRSTSEGSDQDELEFRIIDTGIGIDTTDSDRIFKPFAQSDDSLTREYRGTGLGLSISKHFIEKLGGDIGFTSQVGKGSTFWFTLPLQGTRLYYRDRPLDPFSVLVYDRHARRTTYTVDFLKAWGLSVTSTDSIERFIEEYTSSEHKLILYYLNRNDVDTDLQISINHLASASDAVIFFMHNSNYYEDMSSATGFVHLNNVISPERLYEYIYEHMQPTDEIKRNDRLASQEPGGRAIDDLSGLNILIADDNDINQHLLQVYISRNSGEYVVASDGQGAIELAASNHLDIVIMDVHMPKVDGIHAMQEIKARLPELPVIAVTADASPENQNKYLEMGFDYCLTKPVMEKRLIAAILDLLNDKSDIHKPSVDEPHSVRINGKQTELAVLDVDKAIKISGGNKELAHELFNMLVADLKSKRAQLIVDDKRNIQLIKEIAHKIRGGAKYCAAERVQVQAAKLEDAVNESEGVKTIDSLVAGLTESINQLLSIDNPYK